MDVVSLFSGCGGMDFGVRAAGGNVVFANDVIPEAKTSHEKYFGDCDFELGDIRNIRIFPRADVVVGGYPCQSFSMGGNRAPANDPRTFLYKEFARAIDSINPRFFIAENVSGLQSLGNGEWLKPQLELFSGRGSSGYRITSHIVKAQDYGVPQKRKRLFIVGCRNDLGVFYKFPGPSHADTKKAKKLGLLPYTSHGDVIKDLPLWPSGEFYERPHDPEGHWSWYYMSRNRKADWDGPAFTVVANFRHVTLHPGSPVMKLTWSNLADGWKQRWDFSEEYEHLEEDPTRPKLIEPRRLSWREAARIQTFPRDFDPSGKLETKFELIGNAVPPLLMEKIFRSISEGTGLISSAKFARSATLFQGEQLQLL